MKKTIVLLLALLSLSACSTFDRVFPSTRDEYKRAEALPDLEIPPDLTRDAINNSMAIPATAPAAPTAAGTAAAPAAPAAVAAPKQAQTQVINGKNIVAIPEEFTIAWGQIEQTLNGSGLIVNSQDQAKGTFNVTYTDESASWFQSLLHGNQNDYVISLTGVGDKTELVVLDEKGEWKPSEESDLILSNIMTQYNVARARPLN